MVGYKCSFARVHPLFVFRERLDKGGRMGGDWGHGPPLMIKGGANMSFGSPFLGYLMAW